jgi:hypothetical protein
VGEAIVSYDALLAEPEPNWDEMAIEADTLPREYHIPFPFTTVNDALWDWLSRQPAPVGTHVAIDRPEPTDRILRYRIIRDNTALCDIHLRMVNMQLTKLTVRQPQKPPGFSPAHWRFLIRSVVCILPRFIAWLNEEQQHPLDSISIGQATLMAAAPPALSIAALPVSETDEPTEHTVASEQPPQPKKPRGGGRPSYKANQWAYQEVNERGRPSREAYPEWEEKLRAEIGDDKFSLLANPRDSFNQAIKLKKGDLKKP